MKLRISLTKHRKLQLALVVVAATLFFISLGEDPTAQNRQQFPAPVSRVNDLAGVLDEATKQRLETILENVRQRKKIEFYLALVESTGGRDIFDYSRQLANNWNIGSRTTAKKSLLLVMSINEKVAFTQFSRSVQSELPDGVLGEMSQRMRGPIAAGRFIEAVNSGVGHFVGALARKSSLSLEDFDPSATADVSTKRKETNPAADTIASTPIPDATPAGTVVSASSPGSTSPADSKVKSLTRNRRVTEPVVKPATEPVVKPRTDPVVRPAPEPVVRPGTEPVEPRTEAVVTPGPEPVVRREPVVKPRTEAVVTPGPEPVVRPGPEAVVRPGGRKVTSPEEDEAELEEVNLTLTLPYEPRVAKLKEFLESHPRSKSRPLAQELLISAYAALGDEKLKSGDLTGGVELLFMAIDQAPTNMSDKLFSGVISQIPLNLYVRGDRAAAFKAAKSIETRFGDDPRHLISMAGFYLGLEDGEEASRVASQAVKLAPEMAEAHHTYGLALHISFRLDEAMAEYKRALELDPNSKGTRRILADLNRAAGMAEEALILYREQLRLEPGDKGARAGIVLALLEAGKKDEANTELEAALREDPKNLSLLTGAAYWFLAHGDSQRGYELSRQAVEIEPRYTWAQIAAARALVARKQPLEAERALRFARQYGKFPTLDYELANVLAVAGLYEEAAEVLKQSFVLKDGKLETRLGGRRLVRASGFLELLAPERRAGIFQATAADSEGNAGILKALLAFNYVLNQPGEKVDEAILVANAKDFALGDDEMRSFRQIYAASRLLMKNAGLAAAYELAQSARAGVERAMGVGAVEVAVQADEFRDMRARVIASGGTPYVAEAPRDVLLNILLGRIEDLSGWALFNQDKPAEAIDHLKRAAAILPEATPAWRSALWHLGAALEQTEQREEALNSYIRSYVSGEPDPVRRQLIEQLYRKVNGSLDGLDQRLSSSVSSGPVASTSPEASAGTGPPPVSTETVSGSPSSQPTPAPIELLPEVGPTPSPEIGSAPDAEKKADSAIKTTTIKSPPPEPTPSRTPEATQSPTPEPTPSPTPEPVQSPPTEEQSMAQVASRIRTNIKITGRVKDANNKGLANVVVILVSPRGTVLVSTTDEEGSYSFNVSPSQRNYRLVPSKEGHYFEPVDRAIIAFGEDLKEIDFIGHRRDR
jgi:tetratricopeptide (TPR) repeat protein/uncharacterized membrane protein YgcG